MGSLNEVVRDLILPITGGNGVYIVNKVTNVIWIEGAHWLDGSTLSSSAIVVPENGYTLLNLQS